MKRFQLLLLFVAFSCLVANAQNDPTDDDWSTSGSNTTTLSNVGIGHSSPAFLLHVAKFTTEPHITIHNTGGNGGAAFRMIDDLSGADFKFKSTFFGDFKIRDQSNAVDVMTIKGDGTGWMRIGTGNPTSKLDVDGIIKATGGTSTDWNSAFSWGNHALAGYLTTYTETDPAFNASIAAGINALDTALWNSMEQNASNYTDSLTSILQNAYATEEALRIAADSILQVLLQGEIDLRTAADSILAADLQAEAARAINAEDFLTAADSILQVLLQDEIDLRSAADSALAEALDAEAATRLASDSALQAALNAEIDRAQSEESNLNSADSALQAALNAEIARAQSEESNLSVADSAITAALDAEAAAQQAADSALQVALNNEIARALAAEAALQSTLDAETALQQAADSVLNALINSEVADRINADSILQAAIDSLVNTPESDPKIGAIDTCKVPKWNGSQLVSGTIFDGNGKIGIGTSSPDSSAILELNSNSKGLLPPRMSAAERGAISNPATGLMVYNTDDNSVDVYNGSQWQQSAGTPSSLLSNTVASKCDQWTANSVYGLSVRARAVSFAIDGIAYVGTGDAGSTEYQDFQKFDPLTKSWTAITSLPGAARYGAVAFSLDGKGYVGTGNDGTTDLKDMWEYNPLADTSGGTPWIQKSDFGGTARRLATAFTLNGKAYVGTGYDGSRKNDFWEYDPVGDSWTAVANLPGAARDQNAVAFTIGNSAFVGTGYDGTNYLRDFWKYDAVADSWTQIAHLGGDARAYAVAFTQNGKGYVGTGFDGSIMEDFWEYDPIANTWSQKANFTPGPRRNAVAFTLNGIAYVGSGDYPYKSDFWKHCQDAQSNQGQGQTVQNTGFTLTSVDSLPICQDEWTQLNNFGFSARKGAVAVSLNGKAYIATGYAAGYKRDILEYDPDSDSWTAKTPMPSGQERVDAVAFVLNDKIYIGLGQSGTTVFKKDLWEYNPAADTIGGTPWTQKADFPGSARSNAVAFTANGKAYIGLGSYVVGTTCLSLIEQTDIRKYDPITDSWTGTIANIPDDNYRASAVAFTLDGIGYVGLGYKHDGYLNPGGSCSPTSNYTYETSFYKYDDIGNLWIPAGSLGGRGGAIAFTLKGKAYVGTGYNGSYQQDIWKFDPGSGIWAQMANFGGSARLGSVAFSLNGKAYVGTGYDGSNKNDMWEYCQLSYQPIYNYTTTGINTPAGNDSLLGTIDYGNWTRKGTDIYNSNTNNVGVGTDNPDYKFVVSDNLVGIDNWVASIDNTASPLADYANGMAIFAGANNYNDSFRAKMMAFHKPNGIELGRVRQDNFNGVSYSTASDRRLKTNIAETAFGLKELMAIEVVDYHFKGDLKNRQTGFIAQQLYDVYSFPVDKGSDDLKNNPWMIDYGRLSPLLVKSIQEQQYKIEEIEKKIVDPGNNNELLQQLANTIVGLQNELNLQNQTNIQQQDLINKLLAEMEFQKTEHSTMIEQMAQFDIDLQQCCLHHSSNGNTINSDVNEINDKPHLAQNVPNPFSEKTVIKYYLPISGKDKGERGMIRVMDLKGIVLWEYNLVESGYGQIEIDANTFAPATYIYEMIVGDKKIDSKKMVIE